MNLVDRQVERQSADIYHLIIALIFTNLINPTITIVRIDNRWRRSIRWRRLPCWYKRCSRWMHTGGTVTRCFRYSVESRLRLSWLIPIRCCQWCMSLKYTHISKIVYKTINNHTCTRSWARFCNNPSWSDVADELLSPSCGCERQSTNAVISTITFDCSWFIHDSCCWDGVGDAFDFFVGEWLLGPPGAAEYDIVDENESVNTNKTIYETNRIE